MNTANLVTQGGRLFSLLLLGLGLAACGGSMPVSPSASPAEKQAYLVSRIDEILGVQQDAAQPGVAIIIRKDGNVIFNRSKGLADKGQGAAITENTAFELASASKPITALATMQLVEKGLLSLNDSALKWLPELPSTWNNITLHHLLSHQSGIPDYMADVSLDQLRALDGLTNQSLLQRFAVDSTLLFAPGSNAKYSNSNYVVLAEIISRVSGVSYAQYLQAHIFTPLGMGSTFVFGTVPPANAAVALNFAQDAKTNGITLATLGPTGIFSSTADMSVLVAGLLAGKVVSLETLRTMTTPQSGYSVLSSTGEFYGYGWFLLSQTRPLSLFAHTGQKDGFHSILRINYEKGIDYIILSNGGDATQKVIDAVRVVMQQLYE